MRFFLLLSLCLLGLSPFPGPAYSYYFRKEKLRLSSESYRRYVLPQLKAIVQEYYHILVKLNPGHQDLIQIMQRAASTQSEWKDWQKNCPLPSPECDTTLASFYGHLKDLEKDLQRLQNQTSGPALEPFPVRVEAAFPVIGPLEQISNLNYMLIKFVEELTAAGNRGENRPWPIVAKIGPALHELVLISETTITGQLEDKYKEDFVTVWAFFIKKLERHLIEEGQTEYLVLRLEELNIAWNGFHMKLSAGSNPLPKNLTVIMQVMHDRWNSILKIILQ